MAESDTGARPTAGALLIGDELLSGKIRDENGFLLAQTLRARGIALTETRIVGDKISTIVEAARALDQSCDLVFTSGGLGPTHDDRTLAAMAEAFSAPLERSDVMVRELGRYFEQGLSPAALRMAQVPRGTVFLGLPGWPVMRLGGHNATFYVLPGIPQLFARKLDALCRLDDELPRAPPWHLLRLRAEVDESDIAEALDGVVAAHREVAIGSYPTWSRSEDGARTRVTVTLTFEGREEAAKLARDALRAATPELRWTDPES